MYLSIYSHTIKIEDEISKISDNDRLAGRHAILVVSLAAMLVKNL